MPKNLRSVGVENATVSDGGKIIPNKLKKL